MSKIIIVIIIVAVLVISSIAIYLAMSGGATDNASIDTSDNGSTSDTTNGGTTDTGSQDNGGTTVDVGGASSLQFKVSVDLAGFFLHKNHGCWFE